MASQNEEDIKRMLKADNPEGLGEWKAPDVTNHIEVDHAALSNTLAKIISVVKMPSKSKDILLYKIANPGVTNFQLAMMAGCRLFEIELFEQEGKFAVQEYMKRHDVQDAIDKANSDRSLQNDLLNLKAKDAPGGANKME